MEIGRGRGEKYFKKKESIWVKYGHTRCVPANSHSSSQSLCNPSNLFSKFSCYKLKIVKIYELFLSAEFLGERGHVK